jgi:hypothetical protein
MRLHNAYLTTASRCYKDLVPMHNGGTVVCVNTLARSRHGMVRLSPWLTNDQQHPLLLHDGLICLYVRAKFIYVHINVTYQLETGEAPRSSFPRSRTQYFVRTCPFLGVTAVSPRKSSPRSAPKSQPRFVPVPVVFIYSSLYSRGCETRVYF